MWRVLPRDSFSSRDEGNDRKRLWGNETLPFVKSLSTDRFVNPMICPGRPGNSSSQKGLAHLRDGKGLVTGDLAVWGLGTLGPSNWIFIRLVSIRRQLLDPS